MRYTFTAVYVESSGRKAILAYVEELPGAVARGDTPEDALTALRQEAGVTLAANRRFTWEPYRDAPVVKRGRISVGG